MAERQQSRPVAQQQGAGQAPAAKPENAKPSFQNNSPKSSPQINNQYKKKEEPAKPVDDDMLQQLAMKFKKQ